MTYSWFSPSSLLFRVTYAQGKSSESRKQVAEDKRVKIDLYGREEDIPLDLDPDVTYVSI